MCRAPSNIVEMWLKSAGENSSADENSFQKLVAPNISGSVDGYQALVTATGAFSISNPGGAPFATEQQKNHCFTLNAASQNSIFKEGASLQAPACLSLVAIRY